MGGRNGGGRGVTSIFRERERHSRRAGRVRSVCVSVLGKGCVRGT